MAGHVPPSLRWIPLVLGAFVLACAAPITSDDDDDDDDSAIGDDDDSADTDTRPFLGARWSGAINAGDGLVTGLVTVDFYDEQGVFCQRSWSHSGTSEVGFGLVPGCELCEGVIRQEAHFDTTTDENCPVEPADAEQFVSENWDRLYQTRGLLPMRTIYATDYDLVVGPALFDVAEAVYEPWVQTGVDPIFVSVSDLSQLIELDSNPILGALNFEALIMGDADLSSSRITGTYVWDGLYSLQ